MSEISRWLITFLLNGVWQITAITVLAILCARLLRRMPSRYAHMVWGLALAACLLVPVTTVLIRTSIGATDATRGIDSVVAGSVSHASRGLSVPFHALSRSISFPPMLTRLLLWVYAALLFYRAMRLAWAAYRTSQVRKCAYARPLPPTLSRVTGQCMRAFSLPDVPVLCSSEASGPATVGFRRPVLILPEAFFTDSTPEDDLFSALSHELAHIRRRDFFFNLLYETVYVAVCFHPCAALIRARIAQTRELACDEMAARMLPSGAHYARSLLHIAQSVLSGAQSQSNYALGLFDTNALEERVMNILKTTTASRKWARSFRLTAACIVGAVTLGLSAFSLQLAAENAADLARFAGTWETKYKGRAFFTLKMSVTDGQLGGTCVHVTRVAWVDGELIPGTDETTTDKIVEARVSGQKLMLKIADGNDGSDAIPLEFTLIGKDDAEGKAIVDNNSEVPPPKIPWHFHRVSDAR